jgi:hypothetical protein
MMLPERQRPTNERAFRPLRDKTLRAMIRQRFLTEYGYSDAGPIAEFITADLMQLIHQVSQPYERLQPGQLVWLGVPVALPREYQGCRLGELPLQPIVLSVLTEEDVRELQQATQPEDRQALRCKRVARLFQEAFAQGTTLAYADVAALYDLSLSVVQHDVHTYEAQHGEHLPHRGRVHEIGPTTTHKTQIIESLLQGQQLPDVARRHNHSLHNAERYYRGYNAVEVAAGFTADLNLIALMTGIEYHVVKQYYALVQKYRPEKMKQDDAASASPDAGQMPS